MRCTPGRRKGTRGRRGSASNSEEDYRHLSASISSSVNGGEDDDAAIESLSSRKFTVQQFVELAQSMQQAVVVKDRRHHLRVYPKCFTGEDAVAFLVPYTRNKSKFQAVEMGDAMMYLGLFHHITFEHMLEDRATVYYRFAPMLLQMVPEMVQQASSFLETVPQLRASAPVPTPTPALIPTPALAPCPSHPITGSAPPLGDLAPNPSALEQGVRTAQQQVMEVQMDLTVMEGCMSKLTAESKHGHRRLELELEALKTHVRRSDALALYELAAISLAILAQGLAQWLGRAWPMFVSLAVVLGLALVRARHTLPGELGKSQEWNAPRKSSDNPAPRASRSFRESALATQPAAKRAAPVAEAKPPPEYRSSMDLVQCRVRQSFDYVTHLMDRDNRARVPPSLNGVAALANGEAAESVARSTSETPEPPSAWPQRPVLMRACPKATDQVVLEDAADGAAAANGTSSSCQPGGDVLRFNEVFAFETDAFKGTAVVKLQRNQHQLQWIVQGRFKRDDVKIRSVKTGHLFQRPLKLPAAWLVSACMAIAKTVFSGLEVKLGGPRPFILAPLVAAVDTLNVCFPGDETPLAQLPDRPTEDCCLLHESSVKMKRTRAARAKALAKLPSGACFRTDVVHTFELSLGEVYVNMLKWELDLSPFPVVDLCRGVNGQPLYVMACYSDGLHKKGEPPPQPHYLFNFELWHEKLLTNISS